MVTPWGELPVSDAHVHFFSHRFFSMLAAQKGCDPAEMPRLLPDWELPEPDPLRLAERWIAELDRHGVQRAAIIASLPGDEDSVAAAAGAHPQRFYGYFLVNPIAPGAAAKVEQALAGGSLRGICLFPAMHRYSVHDDRVAPILELAAARPGVLIFIHCGVLTVGIRRKLGLPSPFDMRYSNPIDVHALALRYPNLPFVIPHFGAGYFREALMLCDLCPNVCLDTSSTNSWVKYLEPGFDLESVFRKALEIAGPRRLLFGTDSSFFPRGWQAGIFQTQAALLREIGLEAEQAAGIFSGNLERLLSPRSA
jgi:predicted TIM-barrel fold metal-dependent hydrolase